MPLNAEEQLRYSRHLSLSEVGNSGQEKLKQSQVLVIGAGGLGCPAVLYLSGAGVGTIGIIDPDQVEISNLQRQVLYSEKDLNRSKVSVAQDKLSSFNSKIKIIPYPFAFTDKNAFELISQYDIVLDATDNFSTRYLISDACYLLKKPYVFSSVTQFEGRISIFSQAGPCYRCLYPEPPTDVILNCSEEGILGAVPGVMGTLQALETIKYLLQIGEALSGKLLLFDFLNWQFKKIAIEKNINCPLCGMRPTINQLVETNSRCGHTFEVTPSEIIRWMDEKKEIQLIDVRSPSEFSQGSIARAENIPLEKLEEKVSGLSRDKTIILFCKSGIRSNRALQTFHRLGFEHVFSLSGGVNAWKMNQFLV